MSAAAPQASVVLVPRLVEPPEAARGALPVVELSTDDLVRRVQEELPQGTGAFRELVERHTGLVYRRALRIVGSPTDAEEVTQEVFLRAFRAIGRFRFDSPFVYWLQKITGNTARNHIRARFRDQRKSAELATAALWPSDRAASFPHVLRGPLDQALNRLEPTTRTALALRFIGEYSYREIAEDLGLRESAVKMRVRRGVEQLRSLMKADASRAATEAPLRRDLAPGRSPFQVAVVAVLFRST